MEVQNKENTVARKTEQEQVLGKARNSALMATVGKGHDQTVWTNTALKAYDMVVLAIEKMMYEGLAVIDGREWPWLVCRAEDRMYRQENGKTSIGKYEMELRRCDQLRNLYVTEWGK